MDAKHIKTADKDTDENAKRIKTADTDDEAGPTEQQKKMIRNYERRGMCVNEKDSEREFINDMAIERQRRGEKDPDYSPTLELPSFSCFDSDSGESPTLELPRCR